MRLGIRNLVTLPSPFGNPNQASLPPSVPLLSIGRCLNNHHEPLLAIKPSHGQMSRALYGSKLRALSRYAFCLVTENSAAADYVTEKLMNLPRVMREAAAGSEESVLRKYMRAQRCPVDPSAPEKDEL